MNIYDVSNDTWTTAELSEPRSELASAAAGNKILFAGGLTGVINPAASKTVDIYDISSNTWAITQLNEAKFGLSAAAIANKIVFAGGANQAAVLNSVDIYDVSNNTWAIRN